MEPKELPDGLLESDPPMRRAERRKLAHARKRMRRAFGTSKGHWKAVVKRIIRQHSTVGAEA